VIEIKKSVGNGNNENGKKIVLTGGGTAGHVMPNVALLPLLEKEFTEIHYIGSHTGIENQIVSKLSNVKYHSIETAKLRRNFSLSNLKTPFKVLKGINNAKKLLEKIRPSVVFSKGGFVSYPVVRSAGKLGIPVVIHESDMTMGLANRMSMKYANVICTSFKKTAEEMAKKYPNKRVVWTGTPLRGEIFEGRCDSSSNIIGLSENNKNLLIMGGSLGASAINGAVRDALPLINDWNVLHVVGRGKGFDIDGNGNYVQVEYLDEIWHALAWADVVVSRAGSNALCELLALGKPTVFVPLTTGRGDQIDNAREIKNAGAGLVLFEEDMDSETLVECVDTVHKKREELSTKAKEFVKLGADVEIMKILRKFNN